MLFSVIILLAVGASFLSSSRLRTIGYLLLLLPHRSQTHMHRHHVGSIYKINMHLYTPNVMDTSFDNLPNLSIALEFFAHQMQVHTTKKRNKKSQKTSI
jgi:hypothetical protein